MRAKVLPSGNYRARAYKVVDGKRVCKSFTAPTKGEAEFLASEWVARGKEKVNLPTVGEVLDDFISHRDAILSPSTIRSYKVIAKEIKKRFGRIVASDMTSEKIQAYIGELARDKSAKTIKNYVHLLISALNSVMPDTRYYVTYPKREPIQYNIPDEDAVRLLLDNSTGDLHLAILLGAVGGLRRGEICALKQEDVLRDLHAIYIHADMVRNQDNEWVYKPTTKTDASVRRVELPKQIIDMIPTGSGFIISHSPAWVSDHFIKLRNDLGLKCRFHDLRHYCASYLHAIGIPDQYIQERGGWSTDATLKAVYRNTLQDKARVFTKKANDEFMKVIEKSI